GVEGRAAGVVQEDEEHHAADPRERRFPAEPVQPARNSRDELLLLDDVEAAAVYEPHIVSAGELSVEPCEEIRRANPEDRGKHVRPAQQEIDPFAQRVRHVPVLFRSSLESTIGIHGEIWEIKKKTWLPDLPGLPVHSGFKRTPF